MFQPYAVYKITHFRLKDTDRMKVKDGKRHTNSNNQRAGVEPAASVRPSSPRAPGQFRDGGGKRPRAGSSSSAETRAPFWAQRVGRLCPQAFREGGERWGKEPPGAQGLNGGPGGVAWPGVHAHCDRSPGLFPRILHTKVRKIHGL